VAGHILIAGVSVRAFAESAARAGFSVSAADAYGDRDTAAVARVLSIPSSRTGFSPATVAAAVRDVDAEFVAYGSGFENDPAAVAAIARGRQLLGNPPAVLQRARDPLVWSRALRAMAMPAPLTRASAPTSGRGVRWLLKRRRSGGGRGVRRWYPGEPVPRSAYLQERISGVPGSIVFAADGAYAVPIACTRQLIGLRSLGAHGFRYCGSILAPPADRQFERGTKLHCRAAELAQAVTTACGLRGVNGIDFITRDGVPFPVEVNPRYSASMELAERALGVSIFRLHLHSSMGDALPGAPLPGHFMAHGKAIVFARRDLGVGDTQSWLDDPTLADIPASGTRIAAGQPICTVFATGRNAASCERRLLARALRLERSLYRVRRRAA
jgi:predicted ATP-grasp superfamily ATP-dependent carboligase